MTKKIFYLFAVVVMLFASSFVSVNAANESLPDGVYIGYYSAFDGFMSGKLTIDGTQAFFEFSPWDIGEHEGESGSYHMTVVYNKDSGTYDFIAKGWEKKAPTYEMSDFKGCTYEEGELQGDAFCSGKKVGDIRVINDEHATGVEINGPKTLKLGEKAEYTARFFARSLFDIWIEVENFEWSCQGAEITTQNNGEKCILQTTKPGKVILTATSKTNGKKSSIEITVEDDRKYAVELQERCETQVGKSCVARFTVKHGEEKVTKSDAKITFELTGTNADKIARIVKSSDDGVEIKGLDVGKCTLVAKVDGIESDRAEVVVDYRSTRVFVDDKEIIFPDQNAIIYGGRTLVPARGVFEAFGAVVTWNDTDRSVTVKHRNDTVVLKIGSDIMLVNGTEKTIDIPAMLLNNRTMIPLRAIAEAFECTVNWDGVNYIVKIESPDFHKTVLHDIAKSNVKDDIEASITNWKPLNNITKSSVIKTGNWSKNGLGTIKDVSVFSFVDYWLGNSNEVKQLKITVGKDDTVAIRYGSSFEFKYSEKKLGLDSVLSSKYGSLSSLVNINASTQEDKLLREWFGLSGNGKYSMELEFGKIFLGDLGYYLSIEDGVAYQVPVINKDTSMKVYYKEIGKESKLLFDAADILRNIKIKLGTEEEKNVLKVLSKYELLF